MLVDGAEDYQLFDAVLAIQSFRGLSFAEAWLSLFHSTHPRPSEGRAISMRWSLLHSVAAMHSRILNNTGIRTHTGRQCPPPPPTRH